MLRDRTIACGSSRNRQAVERVLEERPQLSTTDEEQTKPEDAGPDEGFIRIFTASQRAIYLSILPLVHSPADAEEILQETNIVLLNKWQQFEKGTNFLAWARTVARFEVFRFRRRNFHRIQLLDEDVLQLLAQQIDEDSLELELQREALRECLSRLPDEDRELIQERYAPGASGDRIAAALGRPTNSVYQSLGRIRRVLLECVRRRLVAGGSTP